MKEDMCFAGFACIVALADSTACACGTQTRPASNGAGTVLELNGQLVPGKQFLPLGRKKSGNQTGMMGKRRLKQEPAARDCYCVSRPAVREVIDAQR